MKIDLLTDCLQNEIDYYVSAAAGYVREAKTAAANDPSISDIWLDPAERKIFVRRTHASPFGEKIAAMETSYHSMDRLRPEPTWCGLVLSKTKTGSLWQNVRGATGWNDRYYSPSPLAAMLATGILGAGLGYGGAALVSKLLPDDWDKRKFRRSGLMVGGVLGAAPGALETTKSLLIGQPVLDGSHMDRQKTAATPLPHSPRYSTGPVIDSDTMMNTVWKSPMVGGRLTPKEQTLFTGAMIGTQRIAGSPLVTPSDMARLTAGMGVGYASGLVAGKVLGTLTGLPPKAQKTLADAGMYAGVVKSVLPMIYGMR